jgi:hypothetical protein
LLQHARRLRHEGAKVRNSDGDLVADHAAGAAFGALSFAESVELWKAEREDYDAWHVRAAEILEAGAGGAESFGSVVGDADSRDRVSSNFDGDSSITK